MNALKSRRYPNSSLGATALPAELRDSLPDHPMRAPRSGSPATQDLSPATPAEGPAFPWELASP